MRFAMNVSKIVALDKPNNKLTTAEIFFLATLGGAEVLSMDDVVGNFKPGKQFDGLIVTLEDDGCQRVDIFDEIPKANNLY
jgi:guanine deaminase